MLRQLEHVRHGSALIEVCDEYGRPCAAVPVWVEQESHAFPIGCILPDLSFLSDAQKARYLRRVGEVFNFTSAADALAGDRCAAILDLSQRYAAQCPIPLHFLRRVLDESAASGEPIDVVLDGAVIGLALPERDQARRLADLYTFCFAHPAVRAILWRGMCDGEPPLHRDGLLRAELSTKHAFKTLRKLVREVWHSRAAGSTDERGRFAFRGFFGDYRAGATTAAGDAVVVRFTLSPGPIIPVCVEL